MGEVIDLAAYTRRVESEFTHEAPPESPGVVICMDDRPLDPTHPLSQTVERYYQIPGGASGVGHDVAVAMEAKSAGSFVNQNKPVHVMSGIIMRLCIDERSGLVYWNHLACASREGEETIDSAILEDPEAIFRSAQELKPDLDEQTFNLYFKGFQRVAASGLTTSNPKAALHESEAGTHTDCHPIPTAKLVDKPHNAVAYVADYRRNVQLDVPGINQAGLGTYYTNMDVG